MLSTKNLTIVATPEYQKVMDFITWLTSQDYELAQWQEGDMDYPSLGIDLKKVVNAFFDIDEKELENERRALLDQQCDLINQKD